MLSLFVYGTLKRGYRNHDRFCSGLLEVRAAQVRGRLYDGPGYPLLVVPDEDIVAHGTSRPLDDVETQEHVAAQLRSEGRPLAFDTSSSEWDTVQGELISFDDPEARLPAIDNLEGFQPGERSLYRRVLVPVMVHGGCEIAWVYVAGMNPIKQRRLYSGRWPA